LAKRWGAGRLPDRLGRLDMFWCFLIGLLAIGVFGASMFFDVGETFLADTLKEMGIGGAIGVGVGFVVFVYVAALVYGMSSMNGRKAMMGIGLFSLAFGGACIQYYESVVAMLPFITSKWLGIPLIINGGLMCKLGSFKE